MRDFAVAYGNSRRAKEWVNKTIRYEDLKARLKVPVRTTESAEEYAKMGKADREVAKDHGGFVAGILAHGRRKVDSVESRSMLALDGDHIAKDFIAKYETIAPYTSFLYTTHSHTPDKPRVRIVFPLTRDVTLEEFVAVSRYLAAMLGIDQFDECSYLPNQLMYWPSTPRNGIFAYKEVEKEPLNPDVILAAHPEWTDPTRLPTSSRESNANRVQRRNVQDPLTKKGAVGLFNRTFYPINTALERFLSDVYEPTDNANRWHLISSHSVAGVEVIEDKFVYSHHAKDPAYLTLCNAFDIVRRHKFIGMEDKESFKKMTEFAMSLDEVKRKAANERFEEAETEFTDEEDWQKQLRYTAKGAVLENSLYNVKLIIQNDPQLKSIVFNQLADGLEIKGDVPWRHTGKFWRDADDAQLICYVDDHYGTFSQQNYNIAITKVTDDRSYHPIRRYFEKLPPWDGIQRVDTLFIDYLGAEDNAYIRATCRKTLCAAYMRVYHPGIKFDYLPVFNGAQGIGKSTFIAKLGMDWFSDSLTLSDMNDKTAAEKLQGYWIHEISELAGMKKADIDKVKAFVSRSDDKYRAAFGKRVIPHPRQCVFFGTTNEENGYLRDITGNRRFWNVRVSGNGKYKPWEMTGEIVDQIWAEAMVLAEAGEKLHLDPALETLAREEQRDAMQQDDREGLVRAYLDMLLPDTWDSMDVYRRRDYFRDWDDPARPKGTVRRTEVSNIEIWCECFGKAKEDIKPSDSYAISAIMKRVKEWEKTGKRGYIGPYGQQRLYTRK